MHIETTSLCKHYGALTAVDGIDLSVDAGEIFGFLGPNGAGKTTTVKMLLGLVAPSGGEARVLGCRPGDPVAMRRIGFLPEHFRFPPWLTAYNFLDTHGQLYGMSAAERRKRIPGLLERVGLGGRARSRLGEFSKGMQQRVGLAQALLNEPALVFLDEPTSGLDPVGRYEVREIIRELRQRGVTVFLNSHFLSEVEVTCDRVAIVKRGRLVRVGSLEDLTGGATQIEIRAAGLTAELLAGLAQWGQIADGRWQMAPTGGKLQTANGKLQTANGKLQTANGKLQTANGKLQTANGKLQTANGKVQTANGKLQTANDQWPMAESRTEYAPASTDHASRTSAQPPWGTSHPDRLLLTVPNEDVLPAIAAYLVQGGALLYGLAPRRASLEELFIQVMAEDAG